MASVAVRGCSESEHTADVVKQRFPSGVIGRGLPKLGAA